MVKTSVGYTAGKDTSPTYNSVCSGRTGHTEAVQVQPPYATQYIMIQVVACSCVGMALLAALACLPCVKENVIH